MVHPVIDPKASCGAPAERGPRLIQRTISRPATVHGVGLVTGADVTVRFRPAPADTGFIFERTDLPGRPTVAAVAANIVPRRLRTTIESRGVKVEMTEHVLAALAGLGVHNCVIEINAPETPGMDGSAQPFVEAILEAGLESLESTLTPSVVSAPVIVQEGDASVAIRPGPAHHLSISFELDYGPGSEIGRQVYSAPISPEIFRERIAPARTFILERDIAALKSQGLGHRVSYRDLVVLDRRGQPIDNVLRFPEECARHKLLDCIGDFALFGRPIHGNVLARKSGHWLNATAIRALAQAQRESSVGARRAA